MKSARNIIILCAVFLLFSSCNTIYEFPGEDPIDPTSINCRVTLTEDLSDEVYLDIDSKTEESRYIRCKISIYDYDDAKSNSTPIIHDVFYPPIPEDDILTIDRTYTLQARRYKVAVWIDGVATQADVDNYYHTNSLGAIEIMMPYTGDIKNKDAIAARDTMDLTGFQYAWEGNYTKELETYHPFGQYEIITKDLIKALSRADLAVEDIQTKVSYLGYLPSIYNIIDGRLSDAVLGVSYDAQIVALSDSTAHITTDFVMVNGSSTEVSIQLDFFDQNGVALNTATVNGIPIQKHRKTTIYGEFLTVSSNSGITVDKDFDGEINIVLPD